VSEELSRRRFVWVAFLGAIVAMRGHGHLGVGSLVKRLPTAGRRAALIVSQILMLGTTTGSARARPTVRAGLPNEVDAVNQ